jgi:hypothetical protein
MCMMMAFIGACTRRVDRDVDGVPILVRQVS